MLFMDGVGIGINDESVNPFAAAKSRYFRAFLEEDNHTTPTIHDGIIVPTDACLGIKGLPQSATGQTSLFTGVNAQKEVGRHVTGFPTPALREILKPMNILKGLAEKGLNVTFANAYHEKYFKREPKMISATTWLVLSSKIKINYLEDINSGKALFHDLTNDFLIEKGYEVQARTAFESGKVLASIVAEHDFTLFEHVLTDTIGHKRDMSLAKAQVEKLDEFLDGLFEIIDLNEHTLILCSDHGNLEDTSIRTNTRNPVPTIIWGKKKEFCQNKIKKITDITPLFFELAIS